MRLNHGMLSAFVYRFFGVAGSVRLLLMTPTSSCCGKEATGHLGFHFEMAVNPILSVGLEPWAKQHCRRR
jgi:hypothetical protein